MPQQIFSYSADTHAQSASGDAGNSVEGEYSYTAPNGDEILVTYTADENGYVAKSSALPVAPQIPAFEFDPAVLPVAPKVPEVAPLEAPKAYTFVGPHHLAAPVVAHHVAPAYTHVAPAFHAAPAYYPHSYLPYGPHPYLIKVADKP